jgi:predicted DNA-binding antitoxin AbrB/MazE fold protein
MAICEQGVIRPLQPLELPEGARLDLIVITHEQPKDNGMTAEVLAKNRSSSSRGATEISLRNHRNRFFGVYKNGVGK